MPRRIRVVVLALAAVAPTIALTAPAASASSSQEPASRQEAFAAAAQEFGVPRSVLLGVSYMESRWDDHHGQPSTSGGYGPLHLTDVDAPVGSVQRSGGSRHVRASDPALHTARLASSLTHASVGTLKTDPAQNIRGGAAVLAHYQRALGLPAGRNTNPGQWYAAVAKYSGASTRAMAESFANEVFSTVRDGTARTVGNGDRVRLPARPGVHPNKTQLARLDLPNPAKGYRVDCPKRLGCLWIPAPYKQYGESINEYGNHDVADRPHDMKIDYIVIHDTEETWDNTLKLVQDPTYLAWNYTIRSSDGQVAQHLRAKDVGWHAGNWYVNMHSIGIEHEGYEADGSWFTEAMYRNSAALVRYLAHRYHIRLDRAHIIGHDQVPGILPGNVAGMHHDPGPFWNWQHYFKLLHRPIGLGGNHSIGGVVTIKPGFADNDQTVTGCGDDPDAACDESGTNFVYLHQAPSKDSPLVNDPGLNPGGAPSTTDVSDIGARAAAGAQYGYAGRHSDWTAIWYLGKKAWFHNPADDPTAVRSVGKVVTPEHGVAKAPVYGRAYPEKSAYPDDIPYQQVKPLQYSLEAGQTMVLADRKIQTDYYRAKSFDGSAPGDRTDVVGKDRYYLVWVGHRLGYIRAADVDIKVALGR